MKIARQVFTCLAERNIHVLELLQESETVIKIRGLLNQTILTAVRKKIACALSPNANTGKKTQTLEELFSMLHAIPKELIKTMLLEERNYHLLLLFSEHPLSRAMLFNRSGLEAGLIEIKEYALSLFSHLKDKMWISNFACSSDPFLSYATSNEKEFCLLLVELIQLKHWIVTRILMEYPHLLEKPVIISLKNEIKEIFTDELKRFPAFFFMHKNSRVFDFLIMQLQIDLTHLLSSAFQLLEHTPPSSVHYHSLLFDQLLTRWSQQDAFCPLFEKLLMRPYFVSLAVKHSPHAIALYLSHANSKDRAKAIPEKAKLELLSFLPPETIMQTIHHLSPDLKQPLLLPIPFNTSVIPLEQVFAFAFITWISCIEYSEGMPSPKPASSVNKFLARIPLITLAVAAASEKHQNFMAQALRLLNPKQQAVIVPLLPAKLLLQVMTQTQAPLTVQCNLIQLATNDQKHAFLQHMKICTSERPQNNPLFCFAEEKIAQLQAFQKKVHGLQGEVLEEAKQTYKQLQTEWIQMKKQTEKALMEYEQTLQLLKLAIYANDASQDLYTLVNDQIKEQRQQNGELLAKLQKFHSILFEELSYLKEEKEKVPNASKAKHK